MKVRKATVDDLDALIAMGQRMHEESVISNAPIEPDRVRKFLEKQDGCAFFIAESDVPSGFMVCVIGNPVFSSERYATHHIFYVVPEKRGSSAAYRLVEAYENWALEQGVKRMEISVDSGLFPERTGRFYEKLGYRYMGGQYRKDHG